MRHRYVGILDCRCAASPLEEFPCIFRDLLNQNKYFSLGVAKMEYDNITSDEGEEDHGTKNDIKNQPWLKKSEPVNKPIKISVIKKTISLPSQELNGN